MFTVGPGLLQELQIPVFEEQPAWWVFMYQPEIRAKDDYFTNAAEGS